MNLPSVKKHILLVEDETHIAIGIKYNLQREGFRVTAVGDGRSALKTIEEQGDDLDLIILDLMLPGMSGYSVCQTLRESRHLTPVLMLSARTLMEDRTRGFDAGADQYLTKPFDLEELLSRVRRLLHNAEMRAGAARQTAKPVKSYEFADCRIDFENYQAVVRGKPVTLTKKLFAILQYFVRNEGRVIPREELLENVWEMPGYLATRAPDQFMRRLRKIFEKDPANPRHFLTIRDTGYRFVAEPEKGSPETDEN